ncbi:MAG: DegV family protein [Clostridia bacterium]|nr:DegV family protein [Clostridia bacterium]
MVRIFTDSSADFEPEELAALGIESVPLTVSFGNETFREGIEITKDNFYARMAAEGAFPKTSQPTTADFLEALEGVKRDGDSAVGIFLSSGLSGTWQGACLAREMLEYEDFYPVDSLTATCGLRILVEAAVRFRDAGLSAAEIAAKIEALRSRIRIFASLATLENLRRGGRISPTAAAIGNAVHLRPVLRVTKEGTLEIPAKVIGTVRGIASVAKQFLMREADPAYPVYLIYAHNKENAYALREKLKKAGVEIPEKNVKNLGAVIGSHIGPNAFGIAFVEKE